MFIRRFYKIVKALVFSYIFFVGIAFIYTILHLQFIDSIVVGAIFVIGSLVGLGLVKYYANAIISFKIEDEYITLINARQIQRKIKKNECIKIVYKSNKIILEFVNGEKYYIIRYYFFRKKIFDFSELNNNNFKYASIYNEDCSL